MALRHIHIFPLVFRILHVYVCVCGRVNFNVKKQCQWGAASWTHWSRCRSNYWILLFWILTCENYTDKTYVFRLICRCFNEKINTYFSLLKIITENVILAHFLLDLAFIFNVLTGFK